MLLYFNFYLIFIINFINLTSANYGEFLEKNDREYNVIKFKVPQNLWRQALKPTPVLKSPVTIVLPIHVANDEENEIEEQDVQSDVTETNVIVNDTLVSEVSVLQDPEVTAAPVAVVTQQQDEVPDLPPQDVVGQVIRFPCKCEGGQCGCCSGTILERFNMKACGNITFVPEDFVFDVKLTMNNNTVVRRRVSASDPPPICFNPRRAPFVRVCVEISNIRIRNRNAFACLDINADIGGFTVYSASFRCFGLGTSGVQTGLKPKPVSSGPKPVSLFGSSSNNDEGGTILDAAGAILEGDGPFGGQGGLFGEGSSGPFETIGDAVGGLFGGRDLN